MLLGRRLPAPQHQPLAAVKPNIPFVIEILNGQLNATVSR